jgi:hypothetical protein
MQKCLEDIRGNDWLVRTDVSKPIADLIPNRATETRATHEFRPKMPRTPRRGALFQHVAFGSNSPVMPLRR